jgi:phosphohistidine phosphatase
MDLFIIRHAWADHPGDVVWADDSQRPLTEQGRRRFAKVVETLIGRGFAPERIATSPMVRCRQTAEVVSSALGGKPEIVELDDLLPGGEVGPLITWMARDARRHDQVAWVGHAPDVTRLTSAVIGSNYAGIRFSKGSIAAIRFDEPPTLGAGELRWMVTAKVLGC